MQDQPPENLEPVEDIPKEFETLETFDPTDEEDFESIPPLNRKFLLIRLGLAFVIACGLLWSTSGWLFPKIVPPRMYTIAMDKSWAPLRLAGKEPQMSAFCEQLISAIARRQKLSLRVVSEAPNIIVEGLNAGQYDGIVTARSLAEFPVGRYLYSQVIYQAGSVLVVRDNAPYDSIADMDGKFVGIVGNNRTDGKLEDFPKILQTSYSSSTKALADLLSGKVDGVVMDLLQAYIFAQSFYAGKIKILMPPLTREGIRVIMRATYEAEAFIESFNEGLAAMKSDGSFDALMKDWGFQRR